MYDFILIQRIQYLRFIEHRRAQIILWILSYQELISVYLTKSEQIQDIQLTVTPQSQNRVVPENWDINTSFLGQIQ